MTVKVLSRFVMLAVVTATAAPFAAPPPKNTTVTSMVLDYAADIAPGLQVQSDGQGNYVNSKTLVSQIQGIGDWELDAINPRNASRRLYLDFSQPVAGSAPGGADPIGLPSGQYQFRILAQCSSSPYNNSLLQFTAGQTKTCPLRIGFRHNGVAYALIMNPLGGANGPFPDTNAATVTCIFPTTGSSACSQWKFTPSGTFTAPDSSTKYRNRAKLLEFDGNQNVVADHGDFYLSFSMILVK